jgi:hypothetical protein
MWLDRVAVCAPTSAELKRSLVSRAKYLIWRALFHENTAEMNHLSLLIGKFCTIVSRFAQICRHHV